MTLYMFLDPTRVHKRADGSEIGGGKTFEPLPNELAHFGDLMMALPESGEAAGDDAPDVESGKAIVVGDYNIDTVLAMINAGEISAQDALTQEQAETGKNRSSLVTELQRLIDG